MGSLNDYINWRGDLTFRMSPLNEVDSLIFSLITYVDLEGIVPCSHEEKGIPLSSAIEQFFARNPNEKKISMGLIVPKNILKIFRALKNTKRFGSVEVKAHVNVIDTERQMQFSATTFLLGQGSSLIAFRGTDDTLVGWKENFNMSFLPYIPAQKEAVLYLDRAAEQFTGEQIYVAGHSKGGNLAVYSSIYSDPSVRTRIKRVWSYDGPGFGEGMLKSPEYIKMRPVISSLIPQSSVVGMLLEHDENYTVVKSRQAGLLQHDGLSWNVMGKSFVYLKSVTGGSRHLDRSLNEWIRMMTPEQREEFVEALYRILSSDNATTLTELAAIHKNKWLKKSASLDPHVKKTVQKTLTALFEVNTKNLLSELLTKKDLPKKDR